MTVVRHVKDILNNGISGQKILNGLDFPMWKDSQWDRCSYATDMVAWDYLRGKAHCGAITTPYPTEHMRWGLAGTAHAVTYLHIDSDGFATFVQAMCGKKVWAVFHPPPGVPLSSIDYFNNSELFDLDDIPLWAQFGLEAIVLRPGDALYAICLVPVYDLIFAQIDATRCTALRLWAGEYDLPWRPLLFLISHARYVT